MARANPAGAWTYDDLCSLPDDGRRYEIIEGERHGMPAPDSAQAITVVIILMALYPKVTRFGGRVAAAPPDGVFAGANPVQADVVVNLAEGTARVVRWGIEVPPDVPSEVFSPTNRIHDLLTRRALHARAGIREYWLVDPEARSIEVLAHGRDAFDQVATFSGGDHLESPLPGPLSIATDALFPIIAS